MNSRRAAGRFQAKQPVILIGHRRRRGVWRRNVGLWRNRRPTRWQVDLWRSEPEEIGR